MGWLQITLLLYGVFTIALGVEGAMKGSIISLIAGGIAGAAVIAAVLLTRDNQRLGFIISGAIALVLLLRFAGPMISKHQMYPAGVMVWASATVLIALIVGHFTQPK